MCFWKKRTVEVLEKPKGPLTRDQLDDLEQRITEAKHLPGTVTKESKEASKKLAKEIVLILVKVKKLDKKWFTESFKAVKEFQKSGKTDQLQDSLKKYKEKYVY